MAESNRKGSFWLFEAGQRSLDATWELYQNNTQYGWFAGGSVPAATSLVDRIDFANDSPTSASPRGGLTTARWYMGAVGNANYGWFGGGQTPAPAAVSNVERIQYSNDSPSAAGARGTFPAANSQMGTSSNPYYGWFAGGLLPASVSTVLRIDFANDSPVSASIRGPLAVAGGLISGLGNPYYGWFGGGQAAAPAQVSYIQRIDYANDSPTAATLRGSLSSNRSNMGSVANYNYGWWGGGYVFPATVVSNVFRMDFASDSPTATAPRGPLTVARQGVRASGNQNYGWFTGSLNPHSLVDRIDYSNDTVSASPRGFLTTARGGHGATAGIAAYPQTPTSYNTTTGAIAVGNGSFGWFAGGQAVVPATVSTIDRIDFSNDSPTAASPRGGLSTSKYGMGGSNTANYGWLLAGQGAATFSTVERIDYANDSPTSASPRGPLSATGYTGAAVGNNNYAWSTFGGVSGNSLIDRIDYSNDNTVSTTRTTLTDSSRFTLGSTTNNNYGWFAGGRPGTVAPFFSKIERMDYSNDSSIPIIRGPLTLSKQDLASTGNANYGWFVGGTLFPGVPVTTLQISSVDRIDYSNDTTTASARGNLSAARTQIRGTGNANYGWFGGGYGFPSGFSTVFRIDYSNDSPTSSSPRGLLSSNRSASQGVSNYVAQTTNKVAQYAYGSSVVGTSGSRTYGWFAGGSNPATPAVFSQVDRLNFSNDTSSTSPRGTLTAARYHSATLSNNNYGWLVGGDPSGPTGLSTVDRIDFGNDTVTATARGLMTRSRAYAGGVSNSNYGWVGGGVGPVVPATYVSSVERVDFSNDSPTSPTVRGPLSVARACSGSSNANYGWFTGGIPGTFTLVDRIDFANDSPTTASPRGPLTVGRGNTASVGNTNYAWIGGGGPIATPFSIVERIDYSNDTVAAGVRNSLSASRYQLGATGNESYGWWGGGSSGPGVIYSGIDRIDYANDTNSNALVRNKFSVNGGRGTAGLSNYTK
jgi:hypothetical protein